MNESILTSTKSSLGIVAEYTHFDPQIIVLINTVLSILTQLGVGPEDGFSIKSSEDVWEDFIDDNDKLLGLVKTYIAHRVKLMFDTPSTSFVITAYENQIKELEWRIVAMVEEREC